MAEESEADPSRVQRPMDLSTPGLAVKVATPEVIDDLVRRGRYLQAQALLDASPEAAEVLAGSKERLQMINERSKAVEQALNTSEGLDWTFGADIDGVVSRYRMEPDDTISFAVTGPLVVPAFELFCAFSDFERYAAWFPLCNLSKIHHKIDTYDNVIQASMSTPFLARDAILQAWGADCLEESMKYLIIGKSHEATNEISAPPMEGVFIDRAIFRNIIIRFEVVSPMSVKIYMCANVDMKLSLPSWMIAFFVNNMISIAPQNMAKYAMQIKDLPTGKASVFIQKQSYYRDVALPAARALFASRGWTYFPEVPEKAPEPEEQQPPMVKSGVLWKRGQGVIVKPWARRQFLVSVESARMEYYSSKGMKKGEVDLEGVLATITSKESLSLEKSFGPHATAFLLKYPSQQRDRNQMLLVADSYDEAVDWIRVINRASGSMATQSSAVQSVSLSRVSDGLTIDNFARSQAKDLDASRTSSEEPTDDSLASFSFKPKKTRAGAPAPASASASSSPSTAFGTLQGDNLRSTIEAGAYELAHTYGVLLGFPLLVFFAPPMLQPLLFLAIIYGALIMHHFGIPLPLDLDLFINKKKKD